MHLILPQEDITVTHEPVRELIGPQMVSEADLSERFLQQEFRQFFKNSSGFRHEGGF